MILTKTLLKLNIYYPLRRLLYACHGIGRSPEGIFTDVYRRNKWRGSESRSGEGSSIAQTRVLAETLPLLVEEYRMTSLLDIPCGDMHWMSQVELGCVEYIGADIVNEMIERNAKHHGSALRKFVRLDVTRDPLPRVDLIFCRDCLVHLPFRDIAAALANIKRSGARYFMATTFAATPRNENIGLGDFRPINLQTAPFNFPAPLKLVVEGCTESGGRHQDKAMGLWRVDDLPLMCDG